MSPSSNCRHLQFIHHHLNAKYLKIPDSILNGDLDECWISDCQKKIPTKYIRQSIAIGLRNSVDSPIGVEKTEEALHQLANWHTVYHPINWNSIGGNSHSIGLFVVHCVTNNSLLPPGYCLNDIDKTLVSLLPSHQINEELKKKWENGVFSTPSSKYAFSLEMAPYLYFDGFSGKVQLLLECLQEPHTFECLPNSIKIDANEEENIQCLDSIEWCTTKAEKVVPRRLVLRLHSLLSHTTPSVTGAPSVGPCKVKDWRNEHTLQIEYIRESKMLPQEREGIESIHKCSKRVAMNEKCHLSIEENEGGEKYLKLAMQWHDENERILKFLRRCLHFRIKWIKEHKYWKIPTSLSYEAAKCVYYMGGSVEDAVLQEMIGRLRNYTKDKNLMKTSDVERFICDSSHWYYQRLKLILKIRPSLTTLQLIEGSKVEILISPFELSVFHELKSRRLCTWEVDELKWFGELKSFDYLTSSLVEKNINLQFRLAAEVDALKLSEVLDALKFVQRRAPHVTADNIYLEDRRTRKRREGSREKLCDEVKTKIETSKLLIESSDESVTELTPKRRVRDIPERSKMKFMVAGMDDATVKRITDKLEEVIRTIRPPLTAYDADGNITRNGAGTGGFEIVGWPSTMHGWKEISFLIVPSPVDKKIPIDKYNPKLLCSLVSEVYILQEDAITYLLKSFNRWPGPDEKLQFNKWEKVMKRNEPRQWGGHTLEIRQGLATSGLFADTEFHVCGPQHNRDTQLCRSIIKLGGGVQVIDANNAEYVVIVEEEHSEAIRIRKRVRNKVEEEVAATHGARHSALVTPRFLYDCILDWKLKRPSPDKGHVAFSNSIEGNVATEI